jgi:hypothetical protein
MSVMKENQVKMKWALCVRLNETKVKKFDTEHVYLLDVDKKLMFKFPSEEKVNRKQKYGVIVREEIHVYNIFKVTGKPIIDT